MTCRCGGGPSLDVCCGPFLRGDAWPETAEKLMRARYSAYTEGAIDFIVDSHEPKSRAQVDREFAARWARESEWRSLEVLGTTGGAPKDVEGTVSFVARYAQNGAETEHRENAKFRRVEGKWYYVDGDVERPQPVVRQGPKVGRNDPCPCGSGKKHKKCCLTAA